MSASVADRRTGSAIKKILIIQAASDACTSYRSDSGDASSGRAVFNEALCARAKNEVQLTLHEAALSSHGAKP